MGTAAALTLDANRIAVATKMASRIAVRVSAAAVPSLPPEIAAITAATRLVTTIPVPNAAGPYHAGQRG